MPPSGTFSFFVQAGIMLPLSIGWFTGLSESFGQRLVWFWLKDSQLKITLFLCLQHSLGTYKNTSMSQVLQSCQGVQTPSNFALINALGSSGLFSGGTAPFM